MSRKSLLHCVIQKRVRNFVSCFSKNINIPKEKTQAKFSHISKSKAILLNSTSRQKQSFSIKDSYKTSAFAGRESTNSLTNMLMQNGAKCKYQERVCRAVFIAYSQKRRKKTNL